MPHQEQLLLTLTLSLSAALLGGFAAAKLKLPPLVGYLLAGVALGPFTPGYAADPVVASQLADIGIVLLLFGVGIHFSQEDLRRVAGVVLPGALLQISISTLIGLTLITSMGWDPVSGVFMGLSVSIASTVVLLRALNEYRLLNSVHGNIAIGWALTQDAFVILLLVTLPTMLPLFHNEAIEPLEIVQTLAFTLGRVGLFLGLMLFLGKRALPWLLAQLASAGSRELFTLGVLSVALGVAVAAADIFGISLALGAFVAGLVVSESDTSYQAAADSLPMQDAFAVLFFLSVGMLLDPVALPANALSILALLFVVLVVTPTTAGAAVMLLSRSVRSALVIGAGMAQIGEFSLILTTLGRRLEVLPLEGQQVVLATAIISITLNPFLFRALRAVETYALRNPRTADMLMRLEGTAKSVVLESDPPSLRNHAIFCGFGNLGEIISSALERRGFSYAVVEYDRAQITSLTRRGIPAIYGDPGNTIFFEPLHLATARVLIVLIPDPLIAEHVVQRAREINSHLDIVAIARTAEQSTVLEQLGASEAVHGDLEVALELTRHVLHRFGVDLREVQILLNNMRR